MISKYVGVCDSNEVDVLVILEFLWCFSRYYHGNLIVESDLSFESGGLSMEVSVSLQ